MSNKEVLSETQAQEKRVECVPASGLVIPRELFEQFHLSPKSNAKKDQRKFGNPAPVALGGFIMCTTPVSMSLLGWQGAGGFGAAANVGAFFWFGGLLIVLAGIGEWILGNTFASTVFCMFGGFWLTFGSTIVPSFGAYSTYSSTTNGLDGLAEPQFFATFSFFFVAMAILCTVFSVASIKTNVAFATLFSLLVPCFGCLSASFFAAADGAMSKALTLQHVGAGLLFAISILGWYMFFALVLLSVDFPIALPLGDLSSVFPTCVTKRDHNDSEAS